jgi:DNA recombination-dependent growth factor C
MGLLSSAVSINRYKVEGKIEEPVLQNVLSSLQTHAITDMGEEEGTSEKSVGWTSFESPFSPRFEGSSFVFGSYFVFSLRIDRKVIPSQVFKKHYAIETARRLKEARRPYLTRDEKNMIREQVLTMLRLRIPATPQVYDLVWNYEGGTLWFFSNLKAANEELETLFSQSFHLTLIRLFPFTIADLTAGLSANERDELVKLSPTVFVE